MGYLQALVLQNNHMLRFNQNGRNLTDQLHALVTDGPAPPILGRTPLAQYIAMVGVVRVEKRLSRNKTRRDVSSVHGFASKLFIGREHALGNPSRN